MDTPILDGPHVRLEPLTHAHLPALEAVAFDPSIWRYMVFHMITPQNLRDWVDSALAAEATGTTQPWVTIEKLATGDRIVGATRFMDITFAHRTAELGNTWLIDSARGTRINAEAKLLQLTYAFETLGLNRVAFKTHIANKRSQAAIRSIGGVFEGTFRNHMIMPDGSLRDSAWYSIILKEWPEVKDLLTRRLNAPV